MSFRRTPAPQAELFLNRAAELDRPAVGKRDGALRDTLQTLAAYYRELSDRASQTPIEPADESQ